MATEVQIGSTGVVGKQRNWLGVIGLSIITLGIYTWVWYFKINTELKAIGEAKGDADLANSNPTNSLIALIAGAFVLIPIFFTLWGFHKRLTRAQELTGVSPTSQNAYFLYIPGAILIIPIFIWYSVVQGGLNRALGAASA